MAQQTAVEWLVDQVNSDCLNSTFIEPKLTEQAKQMEKEQIERLVRNAYNAGYADRECNHLNDADIYTNETIYTIYEMEH
jgi:hypothetical protein